MNQLTNQKAFLHSILKPIQLNAVSLSLKDTSQENWPIPCFKGTCCFMPVGWPSLKDTDLSLPSAVDTQGSLYLPLGLQAFLNYACAVHPWCSSILLFIILLGWFLLFNSSHSRGGDISRTLFTLVMVPWWILFFPCFLFIQLHVALSPQDGK